MMIDWLSLKIQTETIGYELVKQWQSTQDRIVRISGSGEVEWETCAWDSVKSDSHQLAFQVTNSHIRIQGSPARVLGDGDNVFSCGASASLDLAGCALRMIAFIAHHVSIPLCLDVKRWDLTRVDVTENLYLGSLPLVRQALAVLRNCEGGRYRVSQQAGDTVYWSHRSRLRSGKAYAKGAEIASKMVKAAKSVISPSSRDYTIEEIALANGLLRLELRLGAQFWRERTKCQWHETRPEFLAAEWQSYFSRMIGGAEMKNDDDVFERLLKVVYLTKAPKKEMYWVGQPSQTQAKAAYSQWNLIKSEGFEKARERTTKTTWYRNMQHLRNAGLSDADISLGTVVQFRQKVLEAVPVTSWEQLRTIHYLKAA